MGGLWPSVLLGFFQLFIGVHTMTKQQILALQSIGKGIIESANLSSTGAPGGVIYSALMSHGATYNQFQQIMSTLVRHGFLSHDDDASTYHATDAGLQWAKKIH